MRANASRNEEPEVPLDAYADTAFKMFFLDVGLLAARCKLHSSVLLSKNDIFKQFKGALTEQYVQQQLISECAVIPFYWSAERAQAEVDFLFQTEEGRVIPIEAKAERNLCAKSLHSYCKRYANKLAIRASMSPYAVNAVSVPHSSQDKNAPFQYTLIDLP